MTAPPLNKATGFIKFYREPLGAAVTFTRGRGEGGHVLENNVPEACPICGKAITVAVVEPHPTHPETELHTYRCADCGPVKTSSVRLKPSRLPRAA